MKKGFFLFFSSLQPVLRLLSAPLVSVFPSPAVAAPWDVRSPPRLLAALDAAAAVAYSVLALLTLPCLLTGFLSFSIIISASVLEVLEAGP